MNREKTLKIHPFSPNTGKPPSRNITGKLLSLKVYIPSSGTFSYAKVLQIQALPLKTGRRATMLDLRQVQVCLQPDARKIKQTKKAKQNRTAEFHPKTEGGISATKECLLEGTPVRTI